ncbi:MAG TPA: DUF5667 domain-containing protein [Anaerolineaceae bacterium]|jgi:hypothetical protein|nr:DUF5667 domain-containing protein [Anaerolineaceae bacterium]HQH86776.1 DUF5667 domain-containing protein [Anaerolineaceae bacterium]
MKRKNEFDDILKKLLLLRTASHRDPEKAQTGRDAFLQEAQSLAGTVTPQPKQRHNGWMLLLQSMFLAHRKERSPMLNLFATVLVVVTLVLGGGGATVAAAQSSQPDQTLYGIKLWSEDVRIDLTSNPEMQSELALEFADRRVAEIQTILQAGGVPSEAVQTRYEAQVEQAIQFALNLPDDQAVAALEQVRTRLQTQQSLLLQFQSNGTPEGEATLVRARQMIQTRIQWAEAGMLDPMQMRNLFQQREQNQLTPGNGNNAGNNQGGNPWVTGTPTPGSGYGPGDPNNPWTTGTPTPGSGHGPGDPNNPWTTGTPTPGSSYGPGDPNNPWTTGTPTPGSGYGPGNPSLTSTPDGGGGYGPGPQTTPGGNSNRP